MNYCCLVWASDKKSVNLSKIHKLQKRYCRLISFLHFQAPSAPLFKILNILTIYDLYTYQVVVYMFKYLSNAIPVYDFHFQLNANMHSHLTRQSGKLHSVYCRTKTYQSTVRFQGPKIWNDLPADLKALPYGCFKTRLKTYLLDRQ